MNNRKRKDIKEYLDDYRPFIQNFCRKYNWKFRYFLNLVDLDGRYEMGPHFKISADFRSYLCYCNIEVFIRKSWFFSKKKVIIVTGDIYKKNGKVYEEIIYSMKEFAPESILNYLGELNNKLESLSGTSAKLPPLTTF